MFSNVWRSALHLAHRLVLSSFLIFLVGLSATLTPADSTGHITTLADLPSAAQSLVSATLGRADAAYQFQVAAAGYRADLASNTVRAHFSHGAMRLEAGASQWTLALQAIGYGNALEPVGEVEATVSANRLEYVRDALTEWYVNGPVGLEQGWTLKTPPASGQGGELTLALALEGNALVAERGQAVDLLNQDGAVALRYTGLVAFDATGRELRTRLEFSPYRNGGEVHLHVDDTPAQYPVTIDPYVLQATLNNSGGVASDRFGSSVAISADGSTMVAGAWGVNGSRGAAYVFVKPSGGWVTSATPTATLNNSGGVASDQFGSSVSISADGSTMVAGAWGVNGSRGAAYVFIQPGGGWATSGNPTATLTNSGGVAYDWLGYSVSISADGSTMVAGALGVNSRTGAGYVFVKPSGGWATSGNPTATLTNSGGVASDALGLSVAMSADGSTLVAGAPGVNTYTGAAYVFHREDIYLHIYLPMIMK